MAGWTRHNGPGVALAMDNVDTDQLIPARFMSVPRAEGYGDYLLFDMRRDADGALRADTAMNRNTGASVLVTGRNFGCGSSREAAVYALVDAGFRTVIAPSFGDIFAGNAVNNGLLCAQVSEETATAFLSALERGPCDVSVDLETRSIRLGDIETGFDLDDTRRTKLMNGWDDIDLTLAETDHIKRHRARIVQNQPWVLFD